MFVCVSHNQVEEKYRVYKERLQKALALSQGKTPAEESIGEQRPPTDNYVEGEKPSEEKAEPEEDLANDESVCWRMCCKRYRSVGRQGILLIQYRVT